MRFPIALSIALAVLSSCGQPPATAPDQLLTLQAEGRVEAAPDEATFSLYLACQKRSARAAAACLREETAALHALLAEMGVDSADRQTLDLRLDKRYRYTNNESVFAGYTAGTSLRVRLRDVDLLGRVYDELLDDTKLTLQGLQYTHSALDSLSRVAHQRALAEAGELARGLARAALGEEPTLRIVGIRNTPDQRPRRRAEYGGQLEMREAAVQQTAAPSFQSSAGLIAVGARVWVDYAVR